VMWQVQGVPISPGMLTGLAGYGNDLNHSNH